MIEGMHARSEDEEDTGSGGCGGGERALKREKE